MNDWLGFAISLVYIFALIGLAEFLRRSRGYGSDFTRKVIHIGVGMLAWALPFLFDEPWLFIVACVAFMIINLLDWRFGFFAAMSSSSRSNLGTVYFPLAAAIVAYLYWDTPPIMVAALMPLTWGDGLAPVIGKKFGKHTYQIQGTTRSIEGSVGFFFAAFLATWLALWIIPGAPQITPAEALIPALIVSFATALVEAVTIWGLDNLTVTATAMIILSLWFF
jgi:phytol kinase